MFRIKFFKREDILPPSISLSQVLFDHMQPILHMYIILAGLLDIRIFSSLLLVLALSLKIPYWSGPIKIRFIALEGKL